MQGTLSGQATEEFEFLMKLKRKNLQMPYSINLLSTGYFNHVG